MGEIGLDGSGGYGLYAAEQQRVFDLALSVAERSGGKIMTIYSRRAVDEVLGALRRHAGAGPAILHWFSGTERQLREADAMGCWFSVGPAMLRTDKGRRLATLMPRERMLTETDGPFAQSGSQPLLPTDSWLAVEQSGRIWNTDKRQTSNMLKNNLKKLLSLVPSA